MLIMVGSIVALFVVIAIMKIIVGRTRLHPIIVPRLRHPRNEFSRYQRWLEKKDRPPTRRRT